jgi:hypothetical protein
MHRLVEVIGIRSRSTGLAREFGVSLTPLDTIVREDIAAS